ncbi:degenerin mec-10 [Trichonephila clavipes]|nr:degenerin mec-10 [Trichonephila clavipes]
MIPTNLLSMLNFLKLNPKNLVGTAKHGNGDVLLCGGYKSTSGLEKEEAESITFPAVSVCNFNRIRVDNGPDGNSKNKRPPIGAPLLISEGRHLFRCSNDAQSSKRSSSKRKKDKQRFLTKFYKMDKKTRFKNGHHPSNFVSNCFFNRKICPGNFTTHFQNLRYGNCVIFNKQTQEIDPLSVSRIGPWSGLVLDLYLDTSFYSSTTETLDARVVIHDPEETPSPEEHGFNVDPSNEVSVSLRQSVMYRLPAPFREKCFDYKTHQGSSVKNQKDCVKTCIQIENFAKFGCTDTHKTLNVISNLTQCSLTNQTQMCCLNDVLDEMSSFGPTCDCPLPCRSVSYNELLSKAKWPSNAYIWKKSLSLQGIRKDRVRLNIFYSSLERTVYKQKAKFEDFELLSFLGCELGLWTATAGSDVVQSGRPIFDYFSQHLWTYIGNNTANVVFQMVKRLWLIRIDQ